MSYSMLVFMEVSIRNPLTYLRASSVCLVCHVGDPVNMYIFSGKGRLKLSRMASFDQSIERSLQAHMFYLCAVDGPKLSVAPARPTRPGQMA